MCVCSVTQLCPTLYIYISIYNYPAKGFPIAHWIKNLHAMQETGNVALIPSMGMFSWRRKWEPTPVFLPGESHGQEEMAGYSPWGYKESDRTE